MGGIKGSLKMGNMISGCLGFISTTKGSLKTGCGVFRLPIYVISANQAQNSRSGADNLRCCSCLAWLYSCCGGKNKAVPSNASRTVSPLQTGGACTVSSVKQTPLMLRATAV